MEKWLDLLTPSAAALSLLLVLAIVVQAIRHGRALRRLESRLAEREGAAARVSLDRLTQLQRRVGTSTRPAPAVRQGPRLPAPGTVAAVVVVLALVGGTGWYLFGRDDGSGAGQSPTGGTATTTPTQRTIGTVQDGRVPANPAPLPQPKSAYTILVANGSGIDGAAARIVLPVVRDAGWSTADPANAPTSDEDTAFVMYLPGKEAVADNVAKDLGITTRVPQDGYPLTSDIADVDAIVVIGKDLANRLAP